MRPLAHAAARRLLFPAIEASWRCLFALAGRVLHPTSDLLIPTGSDRVLVIAPHPDDETIGAGGATALHARMGDKVTICVVTDGGQSRAMGLQQDEMQFTRKREAKEAVAALGEIELIQLGLREGEWRDDELHAHLARLLARLQPTIIYTTSFIDYHPEHIRVAWVLTETLKRREQPRKAIIRCYEVQVPLGPSLVNLLCVLDRVASNAKQHALSKYGSQRASLRWLRRYTRYQKALYQARQTVEAFCELTQEQFLSAGSEARLRPCIYRGIRSRPFTDPAAWLVGHVGRRRMKTSLLRSR